MRTMSEVPLRGNSTCTTGSRTSWNRSRSPVTIATRSSGPAAVASVPITSSASVPAASATGRPAASSTERMMVNWPGSSGGSSARLAL